MSEEFNTEGVAQSETTEASFEGYGIGDADTAEGQARRAEEAHLEEMVEERCRVCDSLLNPEEIEKGTCSLCITEGDEL